MTSLLSLAICRLHSGASNYMALLFTNVHSNMTLRVRGFLTDFTAVPVRVVVCKVCVMGVHRLCMDQV